MATCPKCGVSGAYLGFNSIECKNSKCEHFKLTEEVICPCCGIAGHTMPSKDISKPSNSNIDENKEDDYEDYQRANWYSVDMFAKREYLEWRAEVLKDPNAIAEFDYYYMNRP